MNKSDKVREIKDIVEFIDRLDNTLSVVSSENNEIYEEFQEMRESLVKSIFSHFDVSQRGKKNLREEKIKKLLHNPIPDYIFNDYKELRDWWDLKKSKIEK